jgi:hypothetical protein
VALSTPTPSMPSTPPLPPDIRAVHMTGWGAGSTKARRAFIARMKAAGLNGVVIALKEYDGGVYVRDVPLAKKIGAFHDAIPDLAACVKDFKDAGIYTIGRIVLFKDDTLARKRPDLAVHKPDGGIWVNNKGVAWVDPYQREVWAYNLEIASRAAAHFDEIQFDYIRFPSDGPTKQCRYSRADDSPRTAAKNLAELMSYLRRGLGDKKVSVAVFGLTTTDVSGMGIGQHLDQFLKEADYVSPMMYPSHYNKHEYGIPDPNKAPYKTIERGLRGALSLGAELPKLRPYFQDFSMGHHYGRNEVRAQIMAAAKAGVRSWILWNPGNRYTWSAVPKIDELPPPDGAPDAKESHDKSR